MKKVLLIGLSLLALTAMPVAAQDIGRTATQVGGIVKVTGDNVNKASTIPSLPGAVNAAAVTGGTLAQQVAAMDGKPVDPSIRQTQQTISATTNTVGKVGSVLSNPNFSVADMNATLQYGTGNFANALPLSGEQKQQIQQVQQVANAINYMFGGINLGGLFGLGASDEANMSAEEKAATNKMSQEMMQHQQDAQMYQEAADLAKADPSTLTPEQLEQQKQLQQIEQENPGILEKNAKEAQDKAQFTQDKMSIMNADPDQLTDEQKQIRDGLTQDYLQENPSTAMSSTANPEGMTGQDMADLLEDNPNKVENGAGTDIGQQNAARLQENIRALQGAQKAALQKAKEQAGAVKQAADTASQDYRQKSADSWSTTQDSMNKPITDFPEGYWTDALGDTFGRM